MLGGGGCLDCERADVLAILRGYTTKRLREMVESLSAK